MEVLLFGGTAEGRELALWLAERGWQVYLCVATDYGAQLIPQHPNIVLSARRLTEEEMDIIRGLDRNNRLIKGQVFLWEGASGWEDLWDMDVK